MTHVPDAPDAFDRLRAVAGALVRGEPEAVRAALPTRSADWERLAALADRHRLSGYLHLGLEDLSHPAAPPAIRQRLQAFYLRQWARNERLLHELFRLERALAERREEFLFFKGPLLALRLYGRLDARAISDLDLLLRRPERVPAVEAQLAAAGYARSSHLFVSHRLSRRFVHHLEYWKEDLPLELHWTLRRHPSLSLDPEAIWRRREELPLDGHVHPVASPEDELLAQILSAPVDLQIGQLSLRPFLEIYMMLRGMARVPDWRAFLARREREGTLRASVAVLRAVESLFGVDGIPGLAPALRGRGGDRASDHLLAALRRPAASRLSPRWKLRAFGLYECSRATSLLWWGVSLPARLLLHPTESRRVLPWS